MTVQHKFVSLAEFKAKSDGMGGFHAYATMFQELDDVGDIIMPGAYLKTIPQFLERGFIAKGHDWNTRVGMPTDAGEDKVGFWIDADWHSTVAAQEERAITNERKAAGKGVFVSIGYEPSAQPIIVNAVDYPSELPKYVRPDLLDTTLIKANRFSSVRVLPEVHLYEVSLVSVPALQSASVTTAKGSPIDSTHGGLTLEAEGKQTLDAVTSYGNRLREIVRLALEEKVGAAISSARRERIAAAIEMLSAFESIRDDLTALLEETAPKPKEDEEKSFDIQRVWNHLMVMDLQLQGVPIK